MIFKINRIPTVTRRPLTVTQRLLELRKSNRLATMPNFRAIGEHGIDVAELKQHIKHTVLADPLRQIFGLDAVRLSDREDVVTVKDIALELVQKIQNARQGGSDVVD